MIQGKEWYAVYTKPRWEKKVFASLSKQGITAYCPLNKVQRQWTDRKKIVEIPLFTSYVFVQISGEEQALVRRTPGVVNFVYWVGRMALIRDSEMQSLREFISSNTNIRVEKLDYTEGDELTIETGMLKGQQAIVKELRKNKILLVLKAMNIKLVVDYTSS